MGTIETVLIVLAGAALLWVYSVLKAAYCYSQHACSCEGTGATAMSADIAADDIESCTRVDGMTPADIRDN